jgi:hypothetical protein
MVRRDGTSLALSTFSTCGSAPILNRIPTMSEYDESDELNLVCEPTVTGLFSTKQYFSLAQRQMITT